MCIRDSGINELLFINNIFAANTAVRISEIERLRTQTFLPYNPPAPKEEASSQESSSEGGEDEEKASSSSKPEKRSGGYDRDYWEKKRDDEIKRREPGVPAQSGKVFQIPHQRDGARPVSYTHLDVYKRQR